jgi:hypothetical protein
MSQSDTDLYGGVEVYLAVGYLTGIGASSVGA